MPGENPRRPRASRGLGLANRELFEDGPRNLLGFAEVAQVALELAVQFARLFGAELGAQDHVAETHRMRQKRVFLELLERRLDVIVVHRASRSHWVDRGIAGTSGTLFYPQALDTAQKKDTSGQSNIARGKRKDFSYATGGRNS